jgi:hypothetical protein
MAAYYNSGDNKYPVPPTAYYATPSAAASALPVPASRVPKRSSSALVAPRVDVKNDEGNVIRPSKLMRTRSRDRPEEFGNVTRHADVKIAANPKPTLTDFIQSPDLWPEIASYFPEKCATATHAGANCARAWHYKPTENKNSVALDCSGYCVEKNRCEDWLRDALEMPPEYINFWVQNKYGARTLVKRFRCGEHLNLYSYSSANNETIRCNYVRGFGEWEIWTTNEEEEEEEGHEYLATPAELAQQVCENLRQGDSVEVAWTYAHAFSRIEPRSVQFAKEQDWKEFQNDPTLTFTFDGTRQSDGVWLRPYSQWKLNIVPQEAGGYNASVRTKLTPPRVSAPPANGGTSRKDSMRFGGAAPCWIGLECDESVALSSDEIQCRSPEGVDLECKPRFDGLSYSWQPFGRRGGDDNMKIAEKLFAVIPSDWMLSVRYLAQTSELLDRLSPRFSYDKPVMKSFVELLASNRARYCASVSNSCSDEFLLKILTVLNEQTVLDPPYYVSHAADHSVRVMAMMDDLFSSLDQLKLAMVKVYGLVDPTLARFIFMLLGLTHDFGYVELNWCMHGQPQQFQPSDQRQCGVNHGIPAAYKFLHAPAGARMAEDRLSPFLKQMMPTALLSGFLDAIATHNYDASGCRRDPPPAKCVYSMSSHHHTQLLREGETFRRSYVTADMDTNPLLAAIRIADNLDFSYYRLNNVQRDPALTLVERALNKDITLNQLFKAKHQMADKLKAAPDATTARDLQSLTLQYEQRRKELLDPDATIDWDIYGEEEQRVLNRILTEITPDDFLHYYSNWIVNDVRFMPRAKNRFLLTVRFRNGDDIPADLRVDNNVYASVFQIVRLAESFATVTSHGQSLDRLVDVQLIDGPYADIKPLEFFTALMP